MKTLLQFSLYLFQWLLCANSVIGKWKTIDDETGKQNQLWKFTSVLVNLWQNCRYCRCRKEKKFMYCMLWRGKQTSNGTRYYQRTQKR
jgi:hypothetical protein